MSSAPFAPGETQLDRDIKPSFAAVPVDAENNVSTKEFLDASEGLTKIFDALGSTAFGAVKSDILGNVTKLRTRYDADTANSGTIQSLVKSEREEATEKNGGKKPKKQPTATEGLLWLVRGLEFTCVALSKNVSSEEEMTVSFKAAYGETLKQHHNMLVKGMFTAAMSACPYRKDFYAKLGSDEATVKAALEPYIQALKKIIDILNALLAEPENKY